MLSRSSITRRLNPFQFGQITILFGNASVHFIRTIKFRYALHANESCANANANANANEDGDENDYLTYMAERHAGCAVSYPHRKTFRPVTSIVPNRTIRIPKLTKATESVPKSMNYSQSLEDDWLEDCALAQSRSRYNG